MKLVINTCYGGFSISDAAIHRMAELKGLTLYPETDPKFKMTTYWTVPPEQQENQDNFYALSYQERAGSNERINAQQLSNRPSNRADPALVQTVEELGDKAWGRCAELKVVEIPDGVEYEIDEYDGLEHVADTHRTWS